MREGRSFRSAVPRGWARAGRTILSGNAVSFIAAAVLYVLAVGQVRGFAFTLGLTTILDVIVVFLVTWPLVNLASRSPFWSKPSRQRSRCRAADRARTPRRAADKALGKNGGHAVERDRHDDVGGRPASTARSRRRRLRASISPRRPGTACFAALHRYRCLRDRRPSQASTTSSAALIVLVCLLSILVRGFTLGIDFEGGTRIQFPASGDISTSQVENRLRRGARHDAGRRCRPSAPASAAPCRSVPRHSTPARWSSCRTALFDAFQPKDNGGTAAQRHQCLRRQRDLGWPDHPEGADRAGSVPGDRQISTSRSASSGTWRSRRWPRCSSTSSSPPVCTRSSDSR